MLFIKLLYSEHSIIFLKTHSQKKSTIHFFFIPFQINSMILFYFISFKNFELNNS